MGEIEDKIVNDMVSKETAPWEQKVLRTADNNLVQDESGKWVRGNKNQIEEFSFGVEPRKGSTYGADIDAYIYESGAGEASRLMPPGEYAETRYKFAKDMNEQAVQADMSTEDYINKAKSYYGEKYIEENPDAYMGTDWSPDAKSYIYDKLQTDNPAFNKYLQQIR